MIKGELVFLSSVLQSKVIRDYYLKKNGLEKTVMKFDSFGGRNVSGPDEIQAFIANGISGGRPFFVGRFGSIELFVTGKIGLGVKYKLQQSISVLNSNAGFFPNDFEYAKRFADLMISSMQVNDALGIWYLPFEDYAIRNWINPDSKLTEIRYLEPWFAENPWTSALKGKRVLVIHPYARLIESQYEKREVLFKNADILPEFDLITVKAVQTIAGNRDDRFDSWFDALDYMYREAMKFDFDVALIGCGAYGFPLAAKLKTAGKQAIHLGGVLQTLFGIKGARWDNDVNPIVRDLYNEHWVRPGSEDVPKGSESIENGCYW